MPNWCNNTLEVTGSVDAMDKWRIALANDESIEPWLSFDKLLPMPKELEENEGWYGWRVENWGCKWDISGRDNQEPHASEPEYCGYGFETPWGPPLELFNNISPDFPGVRFELAYYEEGMQFAGLFIFKDGEIIHKEEHEGKAFAEFVADYFGDDYYLEGWDEEEEE
jgi:hypothetical protein